MSDSDSEPKGRFRVYSFDPESEMGNFSPDVAKTEKKIKSAIVLPVALKNDIISSPQQK